MLSSESQQNIIWTKNSLFFKGGNFFAFASKANLQIHFQNSNLFFFRPKI